MQTKLDMEHTKWLLAATDFMRGHKDNYTAF